MQVNETALDLKHRGLLTNLHELDETDRTFLNQILNEELNAKIGPRALFKLTKVLHTLHKRQVIVLVDEYDTPTSHATHYGYFTEVCLHKPKYGLEFTQRFEVQRLFPQGFFATAQSGCVYTPRPKCSPQGKIVE